MEIEDKSLMQEKGNVLVIGNSGVGKSTLINAVLGNKCARTGFGTMGTTVKLEQYEREEIPFRLIDTKGFEPAFFKEMGAVKAVKKWSAECVKQGRSDNQINVIWYCVDGTSSKLFKESIKSLTRATSMWKSVPVIVVITKSYSASDRRRNIEVVREAFEKQPKYRDRLKDIIPVVAEAFYLDVEKTVCAPPEGIAELVELTNKLLPEGVQAAKQDISRFILKRKRYFAHTLVGSLTASAATVAFVPLPFPDSIPLIGIETFELQTIARIYELKKDNRLQSFVDTAMEIGAVSTMAKQLITLIKAIPGINIAAAALNALVAGFIVGALGEGAIYVCEKVYLGEKTIDDVEWTKKIIQSRFADGVVGELMDYVREKDGKIEAKDVPVIVSGLFRKAKGRISAK